MHQTHLLRGFLILFIFSGWLTLREPAAADPPQILAFSKTEGFRHASISNALEALHELGQAHGFMLVATEDAEAFNADNLSRFAAVVFVMTSGDVLDERQQAAFEAYIRAGGGFAGIHSASDTEYDWPWYGGLVGAYFQRHPSQQNASLMVEDASHPSTAALPLEFSRFDEWYDFQSNPRDQVNILLTIDEESYNGGGMGEDHPMAWYHAYDGGRSWYTAMGHTRASYAEPLLRAHLLGGIRYAAGFAPEEVLFNNGFEAGVAAHRRPGRCRPANHPVPGCLLALDDERFR